MIIWLLKAVNPRLCIILEIPTLDRRPDEKLTMQLQTLAGELELADLCDEAKGYRPLRGNWNLQASSSEREVTDP